MALTNNTTGASIYELGNIVKADSISEVTDILRDSESRVEATKSSRYAATTSNARTTTSS